MLYIDDRWLYDEVATLGDPEELILAKQTPCVLQSGTDITLVGSSYSTLLASKTAAALKEQGINAEVVDLRVLNPFDPDVVINSVIKTGRLAVIDGGWKTCGMAGEVIASVVESVPVDSLKSSPLRITLPNAPAPSSRTLEAAYYPSVEMILAKVNNLLGD